MKIDCRVPEMDATVVEKSSSDNDVMMESTTSDSGHGSSSETSSLNAKSTTNFADRERRESTSSNPSDVMMMPPSPVSREQVRAFLHICDLTKKFQKRPVEKMKNMSDCIVKYAKSLFLESVRFSKL